MFDTDGGGLLCVFSRTTRRYPPSAGRSGNVALYDPAKGLEVMKIVMARRNIHPDAEYAKRQVVRTDATERASLVCAEYHIRAAAEAAPPRRCGPHGHGPHGHSPRARPTRASPRGQGLAIKILNRWKYRRLYGQTPDADSARRNSPIPWAPSQRSFTGSCGGGRSIALNGFTMESQQVRRQHQECVRVGLYQIFFLTQVLHYAAVNEAVEFVKRIRGERRGAVNAVLRNILRTLDGIHYPNADNDRCIPAVYHSTDLMVRRWAARFGAKP